MNYQISFPGKWFQICFPSSSSSWSLMFSLMFSLLVLFQLNFNHNLFIYCQSCGPRISARQLKEIPCDLSTVSYCTEPGSAYPWSSVRRYIFENQGFVKKMYGEQRQSQIIREELRRINEQYQDIDSQSVLSLRNARKKNFRHFHDHHEENDIKNNNNNDNDDGNIVSNSDHYQNNETIDNTTTMAFHYLDEIINDNNNNEPFTINDHHSNNQNNHDDSNSISKTDLFLDSSTILNTQSTLENEFTTIDAAVDQSITGSSDDGSEEQQSQPEEEDMVKGYNACPITQEVVAPYWANNTRGETLALLNVYPFEQYIHWEKCSYEGEQMFCRDGCKCEQQFRLHRLLAFDPKNECRGIFADWFRFPGCCVCICYDNHERINNRKARL